MNKKWQDIAFAYGLHINCPKDQLLYNLRFGLIDKQTLQNFLKSYDA